MNGVIDVLWEQMLLVLIKTTTEGFSEPMKRELEENLLEYGIESEIKINIKVISVNPDTFLKKSGYKKKEND